MAVDYLNRMRDFGFRERLIEIERDSWILIAAQIPEQVPAFMAIKHAQIQHETLRRLYLDVGDLVDCASDEPRLPALADRVAAFLEAAAAEAAAVEEQQPISDDLVALLDAAFIQAFPCATRLLEAMNAKPTEDRVRVAERIEAFNDRRVGRYWTLVGIVNGWAPSQAPDDIIDSWEWYGRALRAHA